MLFHITPRADWDEAVKVGALRPASLASEGFVHLSTEAQWPRTAARFFRGRRDLVLLTIDPERVGADIRYEAADGERFPHLYGPLPVPAVTRVARLEPDAEGVPRVATRERGSS